MSDARRAAEATARYLLGVADETRLGEFEEELVDCIRALLAEQGAGGALHFVCTDFPGPKDECVFVECEDDTGRSINAGEWRRRADGLAELVVASAPPAPPQAREAEEAAERLACAATEFASQYGQTALSCHYDNGCEESGREEPCPPCGLRIAMESVRLLAALARGGA